MTNESDQKPTESAECKRCETTLSGDDLTYRVLYGKYEHTASGTVSDKQVAGPGEEIEPGADERWFCFDCYKEQYARENGAHFEYETAEELWGILAAADGRLVADAMPLTIGGRGWFRVVDGAVQVRHAVRVKGGPDDDWDIGFDTEPSPDWDKAETIKFFDRVEEDRRLVYLKPVDITPFVAGMNRTLGVTYE